MQFVHSFSVHSYIANQLKFAMYKKVERANSSLRFKKKCLSHGSTMGEDRFNALMILYVHKDYIELNIDAIIDSYSRKYPRRMFLIDPICEV